MKAVRDKTTKEMRAMWDPAPPELENVADLEPELGPNDELVELPCMSMEEVMRKARSEIGGHPGRIFIHDEKDPEFHPPEPEPTMADRIRAERKEKGRKPDAPLTLDELEHVEKKLREDGAGGVV